MNKPGYRLLPSNQRILKEMGENIKLARLRRKLSAEKLAERAGISRPTLYRLENGEPGTTVGNLCMVLFSLGLENDMLLIARDDILGRKLQDAGLKTGKRAPKKRSS